MIQSPKKFGGKRNAGGGGGIGKPSPRRPPPPPAGGSARGAMGAPGLQAAPGAGAARLGVPKGVNPISSLRVGKGNTDPDKQHFISSWIAAVHPGGSDPHQPIPGVSSAGSMMGAAPAPMAMGMSGISAAPALDAAPSFPQPAFAPAATGFVDPSATVMSTGFGNQWETQSNALSLGAVGVGGLTSATSTVDMFGNPLASAQPMASAQPAIAAFPQQQSFAAATPTYAPATSYSAGTTSFYGY